MEVRISNRNVRKLLKENDELDGILRGIILGQAAAEFAPFPTEVITPFIDSKWGLSRNTVAEANVPKRYRTAAMLRDQCNRALRSALKEAETTDDREQALLYETVARLAGFLYRHPQLAVPPEVADRLTPDLGASDVAVGIGAEPVQAEFPGERTGIGKSRPDEQAVREGEAPRLDPPLRSATFVVLATWRALGRDLKSLNVESLRAGAKKLEGKVPSYIDTYETAVEWLLDEERAASPLAEEVSAIVETFADLADRTAASDRAESALVPSASPVGQRDVPARPIDEQIRNRLVAGSQAVTNDEMAEVISRGWSIEPEDVDPVVLRVLRRYGLEAASGRPIAAGEDKEAVQTLTSLASLTYQVGRKLLGSFDRPVLYSFAAPSAESLGGEIEERSSSHRAEDLDAAGTPLSTLGGYALENFPRCAALSMLPEDIADGYIIGAILTGLSIAIAEAELFDSE